MKLAAITVRLRLESSKQQWQQQHEHEQQPNNEAEIEIDGAIRRSFVRVAASLAARCSYIPHSDRITYIWLMMSRQ